MCDGNLAALAAYEKEVEANEKREADFNETAMEHISDPYEELRGVFNRICIDYGMTITFEEWLKENL